MYATSRSVAKSRYTRSWLPVCMPSSYSLRKWVDACLSFAQNKFSREMSSSYNDKK